MAAAAPPSVEELLAAIPGLHKGDGGTAPAATAPVEAKEAPAAKRARKGTGKEAEAKDCVAAAAAAAAGGEEEAAPAPAGDAAGAAVGGAVHSLNDAEAIATVACPAGALRCPKNALRQVFAPPPC